MNKSSYLESLRNKVKEDEIKWEEKSLTGRLSEEALQYIKKTKSLSVYGNYGKDIYLHSEENTSCKENEIYEEKVISYKQEEGNTYKQKEQNSYKEDEEKVMQDDEIGESSNINEIEHEDKNIEQGYNDHKNSKYKEKVNKNFKKVNINYIKKWVTNVMKGGDITVKINSLRKKKISIGKKVTFLIAILLIISTITTAFMTYYKTSNAINNQIQDSMYSISERALETIKVMVEKEQLQIEAFSKVESNVELLRMVKNNKTTDKNYMHLVTKVNDELEELVQEYPYIEEVFIVEKEGCVIASSNKDRVNKSVKNEGYHKISASGARNITETMKSNKTSDKVLVITNPIKDKKDYNMDIGYFGAVVKANKFSEYVKSIKLSGMKSSEAILIDDTGSIIYSKDDKSIGTPIKIKEVEDVMKKMKSGQSIERGKLHVEYNGVNKVVCYEIVSNVSWVLLILTDYKEVQRPVNEMIFIILVVSFIIMAIAILLGIIISRNITMPIEKVKKLVDKTSQLDLTEDDKNIENLALLGDEVGDIAKAMIGMRCVLKEVVQQLNSASNDINENALLVEELIRDVKEDTEIANIETQGLSASIQQTAATSQEVSASSGEMDNSLSQMASKAIDGSKMSQDISFRADTLKKNTIKANTKSKDIYVKVKDEMERAMEGAKAVNQIHNLANSILSITKQTNMLALNAAIEAARAGEAGKGFSVVADEVRKLADESGKTASSIQKMVKKVSNSVKDLTSSAGSMLEYMENNISRDYEEFIKIAEQYNFDSQEFLSFMNNFSETAEELNRTISSITVAINEVTSTINHGASGVSQIANKTLNITDKINVISDKTEKNKESVNNLNKVVEKFKL